MEKNGTSQGKSSSSKKGSKGKSQKSKNGAQHHSSTGRGSYNDPGAGASAGPFASQDLPRSVRNTPPELRAAIRRRKVTEKTKSGKEQAAMEKKFVENSERIEKLEKQIDDLTTYLSKKKKSKKRDAADDPGSSSGNTKSYGDPF